MNKEWPKVGGSQLWANGKRERTENTYRIYIRKFKYSVIFHYFSYVCMDSLVLRSKTLDGKCAGELVKCNDDFAFINF